MQRLLRSRRPASSRTAPPPLVWARTSSPCSPAGSGGPRQSSSSHSPSCARQQDHHQVGADAEILALIGDDQRFVVRARSRRWRRGSSATMSSPSEFILLWNSRHSTPSPRSISDAPAFFFTTPRARLSIAEHQDAGRGPPELHMPRRSDRNSAVRGWPSRSAGSVEGVAPDASIVSTFGGDAQPSRLHARRPCRRRPARPTARTGPSLWRYPQRMARSISTMRSEISGTIWPSRAT